MKKYRGFIIYPTYRIIENKSYVYLYGKLSDGKSFLTINSFDPYFYIKKEQEEEALDIIKKEFKNLNYSIKETDFKDFQDNVMSKIILDVPKNVPILRRILEDKGIITYESDIRFAYRFLFDKDIFPLVDIEGEEVDENTKKQKYPNQKIDLVFENPNIVSAINKEDIVNVNNIPKLKVMSFDIETSFEKNNEKLLCLSYIISDNFGKEINRKSILVKLDNHKENYDNTILVDNDKEAIIKFIELINKEDPDIITGWNVIDFDFSFINSKCRQYNLELDISRDNKNALIKIESSFMRDSKIDITGRMVLDGINILKSSFVKLEDYKLETAAREILGDSKLIEGEDRFEEINKKYKNNVEELLEYNMKDCKLVLDILNKTDTLNLTIQRSVLTGMPLDRVNASVATLDSLYIRESRKLKKVAYNSRYNEKSEGNLGGFVLNPKPGIYDYVIVCDFKSLYPSIIRTFNIDPIKHVVNCNKKRTDMKTIVAPNGSCFSQEKGLLPNIIERLWKQRDEAKKHKNNIASYAIKIHMNSIYGVLGNPNCRFFSMGIANAITYFAQKFIKKTVELVEGQNYDVIYGDTDSVFIDTKAKSIDDANRIGINISNKINEVLTKLIRKEYFRENFLELEFEKIYKKFIMPYSRSGDSGAKKRYAGLLIKENEEIVDITGLEYVRRDWTQLAKKFQYKILQDIFLNKDPTHFMREFVRELKEGKHDDLLVYKKAIRKNLKEYTKTTPPHVKAARMLEKRGKLNSNIINYIITTNGPEPVELLEHNIDYTHYIEKQLKPIADGILVFYNKNFEDLIEGNQQSSLFDY